MLAGCARATAADRNFSGLPFPVHAHRSPYPIDKNIADKNIADKNISDKNIVNPFPMPRPTKH
jgi:hypothetical protein